jgi:putative phosphoribosyl transferase
MSNVPYANRIEAARVLAQALAPYAGRALTILALPRGGVPVGYEIARRLGADLDLMIVRKLGMPGQEELAVGAIASGGVRVMNPEVASYVPGHVIEHIAARERAELQRRERRYRGDRPPLDVRGRTVILVDDGLATGATMRAAVAATRQLGPHAVVVAVPVAPPDTIAALREMADDVVCPATPEPFYAVGLWYRDFRQVGDQEVTMLLDRAWAGPTGGHQEDVHARPRQP